MLKTAFVFSDSQISIADSSDIKAIKLLLDSAYRGETSKKGWTTEAHLIEGNTRVDETGVAQQMHQPGSVFLKYVNDQQQIIGCVNLQQQQHKIYLGMFSVSPLLQGAGIGKQLLCAAEEYARHVQCTIIYMSVISLRNELINWYKRHGYKETGETKFFEEDGITGKHKQPLKFIMLEKIIA